MSMSAPPTPEAVKTRFEIRDVTGLLVAVHVRTDKPDGSKEILWRSPDGTRGLNGVSPGDLPLYGIDRLGKEPTVVVTEGEKAAKALVDAGIPAVGTVTGAASTPSKEVLAELAGRTVILWPDADEVGTDHMQRIATLLRGVASSVRWVTWPGAHDHDDAFDALEREGADKVRSLLATAGRPPSPTMLFERVGLGYRGRVREGKVEFSIDRLKARTGQIHGELSVRSEDPSLADEHLLQSDFNVSSLTARKTTAEWLIKRTPKIQIDWHALLEEFCRRVLAGEREGLPIVAVGGEPKRVEVPYLVYPVIPRDRATIFFGPGGSGKSYLAVAMAVTVASGKEVIRGWKPNRPGRVLVLDWESDAEEWNDRIVAVSAGAGLATPPIIDYRSCVVPLTEQVEELSRHITDAQIDLLIVDSVGMASPGGQQGTDPNDATIRLFQALRVLHCTSLLVDHVSKASGDRADGAKDPYGSVFKVNLARQTWEVKRDDPEDESSGDGHLVLINRKINSGPRRNPVGLRMEYGESGVRFAREEIVEALERAVPAPVRIERYLLSVGLADPKQIAEETGINADNVRKACSRGVASGRMYRDGSTGRYGVVSQYRRVEGDF